MRQLRSARGAGWAAVELLSVPLVDDMDESVVLVGAVACVLIALLGVVCVVVAVLDCATAAPMTASNAAAAAAADNFFW
jgi:hypothetical protein